MWASCRATRNSDWAGGRRFPLATPPLRSRPGGRRGPPACTPGSGGPRSMAWGGAGGRPRLAGHGRGRQRPEAGRLPGCQPAIWLSHPCHSHTVPLRRPGCHAWGQLALSQRGMEFKSRIAGSDAVVWHTNDDVTRMQGHVFEHCTPQSLMTFHMRRRSERSAVRVAAEEGPSDSGAAE